MILRFRAYMHRALLVSTLALAALASGLGSAGANPDVGFCPDWPWPWPDPPPYVYVEDDTFRREFEIYVRFDEFNPAPHWDGGARAPDAGCVIAR